MKGRLAAAFVLGIIVGSALTTMITAHRVEELWRQRQELMFTVADQQSRIRLLTESLAEEQDSVIERFVITIEGVDEVDQIQLNQRLRDLLAPLVGRPALSLDGALLYRLLDGQIMEVNRKWYQITPKLIVISSAVDVMVAAEQITRN